jgi:hypothetical protein
VADNNQVRISLESPTVLRVSPGSATSARVVLEEQFRAVVNVAEKGAKGDTGAAGPQGATGEPGLPGSYLYNLGDVQLSSPTQGDLLSYNQSISKWANIKQSVVTDGGNF